MMVPSGNSDAIVKHWGAFNDYVDKRGVRFSSCQRNLIKTFQIEGMIALITKMALIFSSERFAQFLTLKIDFENQILALFDGYFWPFNKSHEKIKSIFLISAIIPSI